MSVKIERLGNAFVKEISEILATEIKDTNINFVTITAVNVTNDLSFAKVYFTVLDDTKKDITLKALNNASGFIRRELCNRVELRKMPEIKFVYDESIAYGNKIEKIIDKLND
jgi:ribosome-binding factor A